MSWSITLPYRAPASPVSEIAESARALPEAERAVTRQLALLLAVDHDCRTVGDALGVVESADPAARRALLDQARQRAGLPATGEVETRERLELGQSRGPRAGCRLVPVEILCRAVVQRDPAQRTRCAGCCQCAPLVVRAASRPGRRGRHAAPRIGRETDVGTLVPDDPDADQADRAREESRRRRRREEGAVREHEAAVAAEHQRPARRSVPARATRRALGMTAETLDRAVEQVLFKRLCRHEAGHAAAALLLETHVNEVKANRVDLTVEDADEDEAAGYALIARPDPDDDDAVRRSALVTLAGPIEDGGGYWPPAWPLSLAPITQDERRLGELVGMLGLDQLGYAALVKDAYALVTTRDYDRLHAAISQLLEEGHTLDAHTLRHVKAIAKGANMEHLTLKAATATGG